MVCDAVRKLGLKSDAEISEPSSLKYVIVNTDSSCFDPVSGFVSNWSITVDVSNVKRPSVESSPWAPSHCLSIDTG